jgi:hypothetical protein
MQYFPKAHLLLFINETGINGLGRGIGDSIIEKNIQKKH